MATDMPVVAANALSVALADWKQAYKIVDRQGITVQRDPYTVKPLIEFYSRKRVGGGVTFAKTVRNFGKRMPKKQRRLARDSAILAKLLSENVVVIDGLNFEKPHTGDFVSLLNNLKIERSCLVTSNDYDNNLYKSARNIPRVAVVPVAELNAGDICDHNKILFTKEAFLSVLSREQADS